MPYIKLKKKDFTGTFSKGGYGILYKGKRIGCVASMGVFKNKRKHFRETIDRIISEGEDGLHYPLILKTETEFKTRQYENTTYPNLPLHRSHNCICTGGC